MPGSESARRSRSPTDRRRWLFVGAWFAFVALLVTVTVVFAPRLLLWMRTDAPIAGELTELDVWMFFYPELDQTNVVADDDDEAHFDVLFLGGSVLEQVTDVIGPEDFEPRAGGQPVRIYNLCKSAHTSRDSLLKLRLLKHRQFDLVVVYHGINEVRMNCCTADEFQLDYTHCDWYSSMHRRVRAKKISFGEIVLDATSRLIPLGEPKPERAALGAELKTPPAFRANMREIVEICNRSPEKEIIVGTFALHLPDDYDRERYENGELGYGPGDYRMVAESWGQPDAVRDAVCAHNGVVKELAAGDGRFTLRDVAAALEPDRSNFCDLCHLTLQGIQRFKSLLIRPSK